VGIPSHVDFPGPVRACYRPSRVLPGLGPPLVLGTSVELIEYQREARKTAIYPPEVGVIYTALGLAGEAGEFANKVKKLIRDGSTGNGSVSFKEIAAELGDVLWYVAMAADELGVSLEEIAWGNLEKLRGRAERGTLKGSGDAR
jgi:NTP pyrophosphatase (non-canonical NTP hydrolase)